MEYIGKSDAAKAWLKARAEAKDAEENVTAASGIEATNTGRPADIKVKTETANPFSVK